MREARKKQCLDDTTHLDFAHDIKHLDLEHDTKQQGLEHDTKLWALNTTLTKAASPGACVVESRLQGLGSKPWPQPLLLLPASSSAKHSLKTLALSASAASAACFSATISSSRVAYASWS